MVGLQMAEACVVGSMVEEETYVALVELACRHQAHYYIKYL